MGTTSTERMRRMRERRARSIEAGERLPVRDADELLVPAVHETIEALQLGPEYEAAAAVALRYAQAIDEAKDPAWALRWLGPELLRSLEELGGTPRARAKMKPAVKPGPERPNRLAELRAVHAKRMDGRGA